MKKEWSTYVDVIGEGADRGFFCTKGKYTSYLSLLIDEGIPWDTEFIESYETGTYRLTVSMEKLEDV